MAHNLNENNGKTSFFSTKEKAWHGLGTIVNEAPNSAEAIKLAGLDFEVKKEKIFTEIIGLNDKIEKIEIPGKFTTYRADNNKIFGVVGDRYNIVQNHDAFDFFDSIVGQGSAIFETAGCLFDGQTIFITAKLPNHIKVAKDDLIEQYLFLTSSHDGSGSITAAFTPVRIVCNNTLNAALKQTSNKISIRHTASAQERLKNAHKLMGISNLLSGELETIFQRMAKVKITDAKLKEFIKHAMYIPKEALSKDAAKDELGTRVQNTLDEVFEYAHVSDTQTMNSTKGTVFGAYNAITGYFQNVKEYKNGDDKLSSIISGTGFNKQQRAFDLALTMLKN